MNGFLSLDVGGTRIKAALVTADGQLPLPVEEYDAGADDPREVLIARFLGIVDDQFSRAKTAGIQLCAGCVGFPGPFDYDRGICLLKGMGKYEALYGFHLGRLLEKQFSIPFRFFNDAALFVAGACNLTEAKRFQKVFGVCIGTGIGSAFYDRPHLVREGEGVPRDGYIYHLPYKDGILDEYLSATGLRRRIAESGLSAMAADVRELADIARSGDLTARRIFIEFGEELAGVLPGIAAAFGAECLILGGKVAGAADLFAEPLHKALSAEKIELLLLPDSSDFALRAAAFLLSVPADTDRPYV